jgi:hypothetical protein
MGVLKIRNAGNTAWIEVGGAGGIALQDADGDTKIQVEESADEDIIRFDCGGVEIVTIEDAELIIKDGAATGLTQLTLADSAGELWRWTAYGSSHATYPGELYLEERDTGSGNALKLNPDASVNMPNQPAFLATLTSVQSNFAINTAVTVLFATEIFDQGSDFNTGTYTFTAPVTGRYRFSICLRLNNVDKAADYYYVSLVTSNRNHENSIIDPGQFAADAAYWNAGLSVITDMDANDTAHVTIYQAAGAAQTDIQSLDWSSFSGELVA